MAINAMAVCAINSAALMPMKIAPRGFRNLKKT
jgi:hypothetical protein